MVFFIFEKSITAGFRTRPINKRGVKVKEILYYFSTMGRLDVWHYTGLIWIVEWSLDTGGHRKAVYIKYKRLFAVSYLSWLLSGKYGPE